MTKKAIQDSFQKITEIDVIMTINSGKCVVRTSIKLLWIKANIVDKRYLEACEDDIIKNKEDCYVCFKPGRHEECSKIFVQRQVEAEEKIQAAKKQEVISDRRFLAKYAVAGEYLSDQENSDYLDVKSFLETKINSKGHHYSSGKAFENENWWYIPYSFIGCVGYIVEKQSKDVYCLGSGAAVRYREYLNGGSLLWGGVFSYINGDIEANA